MTLSTLHCALCGSGLTLEVGVDDEGVTWTRRRCECGRTDILHIDHGLLDLDLVKADRTEDFEIFGPPAT
jgi:hypothetical protein